MAVVPIQKEICLFDGKKIIIDVEISFSGSIGVDEKGLEFGQEMMIQQYERGVKNAIHSYEKSELPQVFIDGQKFYVTNVPYHILGLYNQISDAIFFDPDAISSIRNISSAFILGHEVGHKIAKYKLTDEDREYIRYLLGLASLNETMIEETFADAIGNIACVDLYHDMYQFLSPDPDARHKMRALALKTSYRC